MGTGNKSPLVIVRHGFTPFFRCRVCDAAFGEDEMHQFEHHVIRCAEANEEALMAKAPSRNPIFAPLDPEWQQYNDKLRADGQNPEVQYNRGRRSGIRRASES